MVVIVSLGRAEYGERDGNGDTGQQNQRATERARRALTLGGPLSGDIPLCASNSYCTIAGEGMSRTAYLTLSNHVPTP